MQIQLYPLQKKQEVFANTFAKYRLYGGAKGGGKSYAMRAECVRQCLSAPNVRGLALRRTSPEILENMATPMRVELPNRLFTFNQQSSTMRFVNGSTLRFSYCRNLKDVLNYQGIQYDFICIEELTHWTEAEFRILMGCLRNPDPNIMPNFFASTNPGGIGHAWVKRLWIDRDYNDKEKPDEYAFIPAKVWDNQVLLDGQPDYLDTLQSLPDTERRAYLEGDWDVFAGQYFKSFRRDIHVVDPFSPMNKFVKKRIVALDYGFSNPSAALWLAKMNDGSVVCYRELYETQLTYRDLAAKINALTPSDEKIDAIVVDPAIVNKPSETTGTSGSDEMRKEGLKVIPADNARIKGWQVVRQYLKPGEDPNSKQITADLKITSNCSNLIRTLPLMVHDTINVEDLDTKTEDHAPDALRYGLVYMGANTTSLGEVKSMNEAFMKTVETKKKGAPRRRERRSPNILNKVF